MCGEHTVLNTRFQGETQSWTTNLWERTAVLGNRLWEKSLGKSMLGIIDSGTSICENDIGKHTSLYTHRFWNTEFRMPTLANTNLEQTSLHNLPQISPTQPQSAMIGARIVTFSLFPIMRITMAFSPRHIWFYLTVYMSRLADPELKGYVCIVALLIASSTWCLATCGPTRWQFNRGLRCQNPCRSAHRRGGGERCQQPPFGCDWSEKRSGKADCEGNSKTSAKARLKAFWRKTFARQKYVELALISYEM